MKQLIIHVDGLTIEEKQRVAEALAKIKNIGMCNPTYWDKADTLYGPSADGVIVGFNNYRDPNPTHTPQQVLEMAGMEKKGHIHAELMAQYAEDAMTNDKPWELYQIKTVQNIWKDIGGQFIFDSNLTYRRKPKTHIVHGVEIPDLRVTPELGGKYYLADPTSSELAELHTYVMRREELWFERGLSYQHSEEGKQAAVLHSKAMLDID